MALNEEQKRRVREIVSDEAFNVAVSEVFTNLFKRMSNAQTVEASALAMKFTEGVYAAFSELVSISGTKKDLTPILPKRLKQ